MSIQDDKPKSNPRKLPWNSPLRLRDESGVSLIESLVSLAIFGIMLSVVIGGVNFYSKTVNDTSIKTEMLYVRQAVSQKISCSNTRSALAGQPRPHTFDPTADCGSFTPSNLVGSAQTVAAAQVSSAKGKYFQLQDSGGNSIGVYSDASATTGQIGRWMTRASCSSNFSGLTNVTTLIIFGQPTNDNGQPKIDPSTGKAYEWVPLFTEGICGETTAPPTPPPPVGCPQSGYAYGGYCYYLSGDNQSCNSACSSKGLRYDNKGTNAVAYVGAGNSSGPCNAVMDGLGSRNGTAQGGTPQHRRYEGWPAYYSPYTGCKYYLGWYSRAVGRWWLDSATGDATDPDIYRICACN